MKRSRRPHPTATTRPLLLALGLLLAAIAPACATLGTKGGDPEGLPHNGTGPFRDLTTAETGISSPRGAALSMRGVTIDSAMVASDGSLFYASATALRPPPADAGPGDLDGGPPVDEPDAGPPTTPDAGPTSVSFPAPDWSTHTPRTISRSAPREAGERAYVTQSPSFDAGELILEASEAWEGAFVTDPWALVRGDGSVWLYYVAEGGIGLARGASAGGAFTHASAPIIGLEGGALPRRPSVIDTTHLEGASHAFLMYYELAGTIRIAGSNDGETFDPVGSLDVPRMAARDDRDGEELEIGGPGAVVYTSAASRSFVRLYYESRRTNGNTLITLAASSDGAHFEAFARPVVDARDRRTPSPRVIDHRISLLYQWSPSGLGMSQGTTFVGIAPGTLELVSD